MKIHGYSTAEVADRLGVSTKAIYRWIKELSKRVEIRAEEADLRAEIARLKRELKRTEQERNILKEAAVDSSGFYSWLKEPVSKRAEADKKLTAQIKQCWIKSGGFHGYRNIYLDMRDANQFCGRDCVLRLMRHAAIKAQRGYDVPRGHYGGKPDRVAENELNRGFNVEAPNTWWVTDITYIKTHEGFLFTI